MIKTKGTAAAAVEDAPPELEHVDPETLKAEQAAAANDAEAKQKKQIYDQMRKNVKDEDDSDSDGNEGCTVEEITEPEVAAQPGSMHDMVKNITTEEEPEFVSNLEELD